MAKYISNRQRNLKIGIVSYTEDKTVLEITGKVGIGTTNATSKLWVDGDGYFVGVLTASQLSTGASGTGINISTSTISGPATLTIDPAGVGDNTGAVRIKGDLYVDGTQFIVNSTTIELADFNVGIATTVGTDALLDGAGIGIGSTGIKKTLTWNNSSTALKSSEDFTLASGKVYKVNGTSVLSNNTLGSGVINSSLTSVGTLGSLSVGNVNSTGIVTATSYNVGTAADISTTITTVATTAATTIDSFDVATFRSAKLQIQITQSTNYQRSDILVIHDGTTASFVEYGSIATNDYLGTFSATISGANVVTQVAMISATSSTVKVLSQKITV